MLISSETGNLPQGDWLKPYEPLFLGGHRQTLAGNYWRRATFRLPYEAEAVEVDPADQSRVLCHCHWQPKSVRADRLTILLVHGLEGSSDSRYMLGITDRAWSSGCNVIRMNMRNCGGTESWTPTLYHSGLSNDVGVVLKYFVSRFSLRRVAMAGYSMGGNLVLKLAGEMGQSAPDWLVAAVGVSAATDLAASADALHEPQNRVYEWHFLRNLMRRFRNKARLFPEIYSVAEVGPVRTIREFDDKITARYSGFTGADDYYLRCSSARVVAGIAIPTLAVHALDDPFIRMMPQTRSALIGNQHIDFVETKQGGHCAFLAKSRNAGAQGGAPGLDTRYWAEATLVQFVLAADRRRGGS